MADRCFNASLCQKKVLYSFRENSCLFFMVNHNRNIGSYLSRMRPNYDLLIRPYLVLHESQQGVTRRREK